NDTPQHQHSFPTRRSSDLAPTHEGAPVPDRLLSDPHDVLVVSAMDIWRHLLKTCRSSGSGYTADSGRDRPSLVPSDVRDELVGLDRKSTRLNSSHVAISYA